MKYRPADEGDLNRLEQSMQESMELAEEGNFGVAEQVGKLFELHKAQARRIELLELRSRVTTEYLAEKGLLHPDELESRIAAAVAAVELARNPPPTVAAPVMIACAKCHREVDRKSTYLTGSGTICGQCQASLEE